jgi:hypothetical protein
MNRKLLAGVLAILGVILIAVGLVIAFVIVPGMKQFPDDVDTTRFYTGTVPVQLNPATFEFMTNLNVDLKRHFMTVETDGDLALVKEEQTLSVQEGPVLQQIVKYHAIDRKTMEAVKNYPDKWNENENIYGREGLSLGWPIGTEKKDYPGWSDDYRAIVPLKYEGEVEHPRAKIKTYYFTAANDAQPIVPEAVAAMGLPTEIPQAQLAKLVGGMEGLNPVIAQAFPLLIKTAQWPDPVPLSYVYEYTGEYWVEPVSGVLIDTHKIEIRSVSVPDELLAALAEKISALPGNVDPAILQELLPIPVSHLEYQATDESVQDAKKDADDAKSQIQLFGTIIPLAAGLIGLVLVALAILLYTRKS